MATLSQVTVLTRKVLVIIGACIGAIILIALGMQIFTNIRQTFFPQPPPPPTVSFGKINPLSFPMSNYEGNYTYTLNTVSGGLPFLGDRVTVYKLLQPQPSLLGLQKAKDTLSKIEFTDQPTQLTDTEFLWKSNANLNPQITYNIVTNSFLYQTTYMTDPTILAANSLPNTTDAIAAAKNFFTNLDAFPDDLDLDLTTSSLFAISDGTLTPTTSLSHSQIVRINFFQKDLNKLPIYTPNYPSSPFYILLGSGNGTTQVAEAGYSHQTILNDFTATYPIKTAQEAFDLLKKGQGYISHVDGNQKNITIRDVSLGYYIGQTTQSVALPIIVFQGDNNFYAFIPAITDEWMNK